MDKKVKLLLLSIGIALLVAIASTSYAYFTISNKTGSEETITSGTMALTLHDGAKIETDFMIPGEYIEKSFYVTNTGSLATSYDIYLSEVINDFADKTDLVYTLTSSDGGYNTSSQVQVPSASAKIVDNQSIGTSTTHHYTLRITFLNKNENQDDNQGKHFSGKIQINEYQDIDVIPTIDTCPNCKYLFYLSSDYGSTEYIPYDGITPLSSTQMNMLQNNYEDVVEEVGKPVFLGLDVNENTNIVEKAYVCGIENDVPFCLEASKDGSTYTTNQEIMMPLFGTFEWDQTSIDTFTGCYVSNDPNVSDNTVGCRGVVYSVLVQGGYIEMADNPTTLGCAYNPDDDKLYCTIID